MDEPPLRSQIAHGGLVWRRCSDDYDYLIGGIIARGDQGRRIRMNAWNHFHALWYEKSFQVFDWVEIWEFLSNWAPTFAKVAILFRNFFFILVNNLYASQLGSDCQILDLEMLKNMIKGWQLAVGRISLRRRTKKNAPMANEMITKRIKNYGQGNGCSNNGGVLHGSEEMVTHCLRTMGIGHSVGGYIPCPVSQVSPKLSIERTLPMFNDPHSIFVPAGSLFVNISRYSCLSERTEAYRHTL
uniref:DNA-directed RNA polymerase n=1 Tax=Panagrellus redivivus TaxID=6233 RepID=A0A7E4UMN8_PANRE